MHEFVNTILKEIFLNHPILVILAAITIICTVFSSQIIGMSGEFWVRMKLKKLPNDYLTINNLMIRVDNKTCQIDHLVVSKYGIFVIETKKYGGYIRGNDYDKNWEYWIKNKVYYIHNPVHQNYGHVQALKQLLKAEEKFFIPIVCMCRKTGIYVKSEQVVLIDDLIPTILKYKDEKIIYYKEIYNYFKMMNVKDVSSRRKHITNTKKIVNEKKIDNINKCPKCGGYIVERTSKYGKFIGCSNYPKCKYTKKINYY